MEDDRKAFLLRVRRHFPAGLLEGKKKKSLLKYFSNSKKNSRLKLIFFISPLFPLNNTDNRILNYATYMKFLKPKI